MHAIKIMGSGYCLPKQKITNKEMKNRWGIEESWIYQRTGIQNRYYVTEENIEDLAIGAVENLLQKIDFSVDKIGMIVVATTSTRKLMPGISFAIQKHFTIPKCMCFDILAGCGGYVDAFDLVRKAIAIGDIEYGLVVGAEVLSYYLNKQDINTAILLGDGAGATLLGKAEEKKIYHSFFESDGKNNEILTCTVDQKIYMEGKKIYKFGTTKTVDNIKELLKKASESIENIDYIIPHQSNLRMLESICQKLDISLEKMYCNLEQVGNTFCASIPIALAEMQEKHLLMPKEKIILLRLWRRIKCRKHFTRSVKLV